MLQEKALAHIRKAASKSTKISTPDFSGDWVNDLGSKMCLAVTGSQISGTYESAVSSDGGSIKGDLVGVINGDLIAFVVNWPVPAITAWVGQLVYESGKEIVPTLWHMTVNVPDQQEPTEMWQSVYAGSDTFHR